ncbi:MAG: 2-oxoacid:acceptor oxidoreductase family protein [Rhodospirillaceae bacterium]|nr:2-oxoacid:acceptor oxidoreductase family protein [Rhodospirillaceae bacterium]
MNEMRPFTLLIGALGGEGGGVLTGWIVSACESAGLPVQATSIPGVAQRTGATTYYIEIWPEQLTDKRPIFSLSPAPGEVDVVATTELVEAGRAIASGFVTPERTALIASNHRVYTTFEKMAPGDGRYDDERIVAAINARAKKHVLINMDRIASENRTRINAVMLGVLSTAGILPIGANLLRDAIKAGGKSVEANLCGFDAGTKAASEEKPATTAPNVQGLIDEAISRLRDFQGEAYAELFLKRIKPFQGGNPELLAEVVKGLARIMAYNDIIRVAQLKTRSARMKKINAESKDGEIVRITEYFRPGINEIADILPAPIGRVLNKWASVKQRRFKYSWPMKISSNSFGAILLLKFLASLRPLRGISYGYHANRKLADEWLADVENAMKRDVILAREIAKNSSLIKGYGETHSRSEVQFNSIRAAYVMPAISGEAVNAEQIASAREQALADISS